MDYIPVVAGTNVTSGKQKYCYKTSNNRELKVSANKTQSIERKKNAKMIIGDITSEPA